MSLIEEKFLPACFDPPWRNRYFEHSETKQTYRFVAGAVAWPGLRPSGFAVVVGVAVEDHPVKKIPALHCLAEIEEENITKLIFGSVKLRKEYMAREWYGDVESPNSPFLYSVNKDLQQAEQASFWLIPAYNIKQPGSFSYYARLIGDHLKADEKLLFLGDCTRLQGYIEHFPEEAGVKGTPEEFPAIAALGYAVASLRNYRPWEYYGQQDPGPTPPLDPFIGY